MSEIKYINDDLAILAEHGIIVSIASPEPVVSPTTPKPEKPNEGGNTDVAFWGEENDFPQQVIDKAKADTEILPLLDWKGRVLQGREVVAVNLVWNEEKKDFDVVRINDQEINDFLTEPFFERYWREACVDFSWFHNVFPDLIKSTGMDKIAYLGVHEAAWCRWNKQNEKGLITTCYVASNWPDAKVSQPEVFKLPVVDPYKANLVDDVKKLGNKARRFVYPTNYPTPGSAYYPIAPWTAYLFSDWANIKKMVSKMKVSLINRILSAKWILSIPVNYWPAAHPDWESKTPDERKEIKKAKVKEINDTITGVDNAGKLILIEVGFDREGKEIPGWKLEPLPDVLKDGAFVEDSREASDYLNRALSVDPALVGDGPGKTNSGSSSSDKRVAFNMLVALLNPYRKIILEPLYFIAKYNGWKDRYPNIRFKVLEIELETLDKSHATSKETNPVTTNPAKEGAGK